MVDYTLSKYQVLERLLSAHANLIGYTRYEQHITNPKKSYSKLALNYQINYIRELYALYFTLI